MDKCHDAPGSPGSPKIERQPLRAETNFDGTKLPLEPSRPKTTTYGVKLLFHLFSIGQSCTSHLTFAPPLVIQKSHSHINRSLGNWMRVASARVPLEVLCPSVILKTE
jgi:hypothetical protein